LIENALAELQLQPEQRRQIDELKAQAKARHAPVKEAMRALAIALAAQIEKGDIDRCALDKMVTDLASAMAKAHPGDRAALQGLHAILNSEQRTKLVDGIKRGLDEHMKMHGAQRVTEKIARKLDLREDQKVSVQKILTAFQEVRKAQPGAGEHGKRWKAILDAFTGDRFVLDEVAPATDVTAKRTRLIERHLVVLEAILPVLTDAQRTTLVEKIREKAGAKDASRGGEEEEEDDDDEEEDEEGAREKPQEAVGTTSEPVTAANAVSDADVDEMLVGMEKPDQTD
jgi:Spy/CpxP family protein refolding chaperone